MLRPKRVKYRKPYRGIGKSRIHYMNLMFFGNYGLQSLNSRWLTSRQVESSRRVIIRYVRRVGNLWIRVFPDKMVTKRPTEIRIGSRKGNQEYWVSNVSLGTMLFELNDISEWIAKKAMQIVSSKLPIMGQFHVKENYTFLVGRISFNL